VWAIAFYLNMLDEIYDSIDDGLENSKILIIQNAQADTSIIKRTGFRESNYEIREISAERAASFRDVYMDSTLYMINEKDYEPVRILKSAFGLPNGQYYELHVFSSMIEEDDLIEDLFYSLLWLYIILVASILLINNVLLKKIWQPFYQILERLKRFSLDSSESMAPPKTRVQEFKLLSDSVTALLDRTTAAFNSQKQFIENASHELQTPLAISINKLELFVEKSTTDEHQAHEISTVIQSLERLKRLNKTLLLLSRIENRQFSDRSKVNINQCVKAVSTELSDLASFKSVNVSIHDEASVTFEMNLELATIMISNLLKNAIIHNVEGGTAKVRINDSGFIVENSGKGEALDSSKIFKRFYKSTGSNSSTGLGLSIVKSIADVYGIVVRYRYNGKHSFAVELPDDSVELNTLSSK
jgi:signal transduction histidine kinase